MYVHGTSYHLSFEDKNLYLKFIFWVCIGVKFLSFKLREENILKVFVYRVLRRIFGPKRQDLEVRHSVV
jgi:hypothetical protein